jgi:O-acetyl-ADP-ribose deacetylase (regulator of RNase III)
MNRVIRKGTGDLLAADVDALVNTVNTVGIMGKGIALQFKRRYPANFRAYEKACKAGEVKLGEIFVFDAGQLVRPRWIINFPTKGHWRSNSRLNDVADGLDDLVRVIRELDIRSIAVPPLGCGNGGLDWAIVEPLIHERLSSLDAEIVVFPPAGTPLAEHMVSRGARPQMTKGKAALVRLIERYAPPSFGPGLVEVQKLMYFLQVSGEELKLRFSKAQYGPYADNLRQVLIAVEGHYLRGYGDGSQWVLDSGPITVMPGAVEESNAALEEALETQQRIERVLGLVEGFESTYGMELLATVHWAATVEGCHDRACVVETVHGWSLRKGSLFTADHIGVALDRLSGSGWLPVEFAA